MQEGAEATLAKEAERLRTEVNDAFNQQLADLNPIGDDERKAVKALGYDLDALADAYRGSLDVLTVRNGFKLGFDEVESFIHAGRVFTMLDLATLFELGTAQVRPRPHWGPVLRRFRSEKPQVAQRMKDAVWERLAA